MMCFAILFHNLIVKILYRNYGYAKIFCLNLVKNIIYFILRHQIFKLVLKTNNLFFNLLVISKITMYLEF